jgi:hypothetical protein
VFVIGSVEVQSIGGFEVGSWALFPWLWILQIRECDPRDSVSRLE